MLCSGADHSANVWERQANILQRPRQPAQVQDVCVLEAESQAMDAYEKHETLGEGTFGVVFKAIHKEVQKLVHICIDHITNSCLV